MIWFTATHKDTYSQNTFEVLCKSIGQDYICQPVLNIFIYNVPIANLFCNGENPYTDIIFTSYYGVKAYIQNGGVIDRPVICVGEKLQQYILENIKKDITITMFKNSKDALEHIYTTHTPQQKYLYPSGENITRDIPILLQEKSIECYRHIVYRSDMVFADDGQILDMIHQKKISSIALYSQRAVDSIAKYIATYTPQQPLDKPANTVILYCLSPAIGEKCKNILSKYFICDIKISIQPNHNSMVTMIKEHIHAYAGER